MWTVQTNDFLEYLIWFCEFSSSKKSSSAGLGSQSGRATASEETGIFFSWLLLNEKLLFLFEDEIRIDGVVGRVGSGGRLSGRSTAEIVRWYAAPAQEQGSTTVFKSIPNYC